MLQMGRRIALVFRILFTGSAFFVFWWGGLLLSWTVLPALRFRHRRDPQEGSRRCRNVLNRSLRLHAEYMRFFALVDFEPSEIEQGIPLRGPFVMVANHPTLIDVVLLLALYPSMYCVVKGAVMHSPFVGRMLQYGDHIDAGDGGPMSGVSVVQGAVDRLRGGDPVLIFPEGTRSPIDGMGEFRQGAFVIAQAANVPVVPVHIDCTPRGLMRGMKWYTVPEGTMRFRFRVLAPVSPQAFGGARAMARSVRASLAAEFPPDLSPPVTAEVV
jgi:1-acyl-sn-glycerol-3-phosphate acyltransferase